MAEMREAFSKQLSNLYNMVTFKNSQNSAAKRRSDEAKTKTEAELTKTSKENNPNQERKLFVYNPNLHDYGRIDFQEMNLNTLIDPAFARK
jgi:hypothetical protein